MKRVNKGFSLIEVIFTLFIVSIILAGILSMSTTFESAKNKKTALAMAEMITHSIFSAMRLNPQGWRDKDGVDDFRNINSSTKDCIGALNQNQTDCTFDELFDNQLSYLKNDLFDSLTCEDFSSDEASFCLNLNNSSIKKIGECSDGTTKISKFKIDLVIQYGNNEAISKPYSLSTIVCI